MIEFYKTSETGTVQVEKAETGCWINVIAPTKEEHEFLTDHIGVLPEFIQSSLDEEERSHIDHDEDMGQSLVIVDYPSLQNDNDTNEYFTCPLGVVILHGYVVTISLYESWSINELRYGHIKGIDTRLKTRFLLILLLCISQRYLMCLRQIDRLSSQTEKRLQKSMDNEELLQLLGLEKSLVYFSTSLKSDEATLNRIHRGKQIKLYEEDEDLLEDVIIEMNQAIEMCSIYSGILSGMRDAFSSVISNNMNNVMKMLAIITLVLSVPNIIFGYYGMNVPDLPIPYVFFPTLVCTVSCAVSAWVLLKSKAFK